METTETKIYGFHLGAKSLGTINLYMPYNLTLLNQLNKNSVALTTDHSIESSVLKSLDFVDKCE